MTDSIRVSRTIARIGLIEVEGFTLTSTSHRMSQMQAAKCVGKSKTNARRFLNSKVIKLFSGKGFIPDALESNLMNLNLESSSNLTITLPNDNRL